MKRLKLVEQKRRREIEDEKQEATGKLDLARVWEMEAFDRTVREDYGDYVDGVVDNKIMTSPENRLRCLEFSHQLSVLENLAAQARTIAHDGDERLYRRGIKTVSGAQEYLSKNEPEREFSE